MDFLRQIFENCSIVHPGLLATITLQLFFDRVSMGNINVFKIHISVQKRHWPISYGHQFVGKHHLFSFNKYTERVLENHPSTLRSQTHLIAMDSPELCQSPLWRLQAPVWNSHPVKKVFLSFFL